MNCFDNGHTRAAAEGINNKARMGSNPTDTQWDRLILDLDLATEAVGETIERIRGLMSGLKGRF